MMVEPIRQFVIVGGKKYIMVALEEGRTELQEVRDLPIPPEARGQEK